MMKGDFSMPTFNEDKTTEQMVINVLSKNG